MNWAPNCREGSDPLREATVLGWVAGSEIVAGWLKHSGLSKLTAEGVALLVGIMQLEAWLRPFDHLDPIKKH